MVIYTGQMVMLPRTVDQVLAVGDTGQGTEMYAVGV